MKKTVIDNLDKVRTASPLVHNITNYVVMNNTANALLAVGASPVMAHAAEEMEDFVKNWLRPCRKHRNLKQSLDTVHERSNIIRL